MTAPKIPPEFQVTTAEDIERNSRMMTRLKVAQVLSNQPLITTRASKIPIRDTEWMWPGRVAMSEVNMFAGEPGTRKSWMAFDLAARVSVGGPLPCGPHLAPKGRVLIVSGEDAANTTIVPRLKAAGADLDMIDILDNQLSSNFSFRNLGPIENILTKEYKLLEIDPVACFFDGNTDSNNSTDVRGALRGIAELTSRIGAATLMVHHLRKSEGKAAHRVAGSGAFVAMPRSVFVVHEDQDREEVSVLGHVKCNLAMRQPPLEFEVDCQGGEPHLVWRPSTDEILRHCESAKAGSRSRAEIWLLGILAEGAKQVTDVEVMAKTNGISVRTLDRARAKLKEAGKLMVCKQGEEGTWWLDLPGRALEY